jgi:hypothetical protein
VEIVDKGLAVIECFGVFVVFVASAVGGKVGLGVSTCLLSKFGEEGNWHDIDGGIGAKRG